MPATLAWQAETGLPSEVGYHVQLDAVKRRQHTVCNLVSFMRRAQAALAMQRAQELQPAAHQAEALERLMRRIPDAHAEALKVCVVHGETHSVRMR